MPYYCDTAGQEPAAPVDWSALFAAALALPEGEEQDAAVEAVTAQRLATASHVIRHGGRVRVAADDDAPALAHEPLPFAATLAITGEPDQHGGRRLLYEGRLVRCPECLAPVRFVES